MAFTVTRIDRIAFVSNWTGRVFAGTGLDWQVYWVQRHLEGKVDAVPPDRR